MAESWPGEHVYRVNNIERALEAPPTDVKEIATLRNVIEPWLTTLIGSEHLSLLVGSGLMTAVTTIIGAESIAMAPVQFDLEHDDGVRARAAEVAAACGRGTPNIEDQVRAALELVGGLRIMGNELAEEWQRQIDARLRAFAIQVLDAERALLSALSTDDGSRALNVVSSFLGSFASRSGTRDRLHLFTTNYDRMIEFALDQSGIWKLDRFLGSIAPVFRASRLDVDLHYSPPGIRGEPRYLEGVVRLTKLHGSVDWVAHGNRIERLAVPFGCAASTYENVMADQSSLLVYPNPAKDVETSEYPYAELFRDFASAIVRPNSVLVTYGYGFGDDHINRVIADMLTVPSTHLLAIVFSDIDGRLRRFLDAAGRENQTSVLMGNHFGDVESLAHFYLPKPSIDRITAREVELLRRRGLVPPEGEEDTHEGMTTGGPDDGG